MQNFLIFLCVILAVIAFAKADECTYLGKTLKVGESFSKPGECQLITCTGRDSIRGKTCGQFALIDETKYRYIPQDNSKPYPDCCPSLELIEKN